MTRVVTVEQLVNTLDINIVYGHQFKDNKITSSEVSRPGLVLTGYDNFHPHYRIQLMGKTEISYLNTKTSLERTEIFETMCTHETPAVIFSRELPVPAEILPTADKYEIPLLSARSKTSRVLSNVTNYLEGELAERISMHGVFVEVFGMGVLLKGASGVGKSETGLELIQRGHRLIADDRVDFFMVDELTLIGESPEILENLMEIRGMGIINVMTLYGVSSVRRSKRLELIIELVIDDGTVEYDRLGHQKLFETIGEVEVPKIKIPVKIGRNLAVIIESAAMNFRASQMGFDATESFNRKLDQLIIDNREV